MLAKEHHPTHSTNAAAPGICLQKVPVHQAPRKADGHKLDTCGSEANLVLLSQIQLERHNNHQQPPERFKWQLFSEQL